MEEILDARVQLLVGVGAAAAGKCQKCFAKLYGMAAAAGVSDREIRAAVAIGAKVAEKSQGFMAEFIEETMHGARAASERAEEAARSPCACNP